MKAAIIASLVAQAAAGTILWDGRFNDLSSSADLLKWSWSSEVGPYQYYIHGASNVTSYVNLATSYKNPADGGSKQGAKITLDSTAYWNGQTMRRTELIPQTTAAINSGKVFYHFSMMRSDTNAPSIYREHQILFFESHFTEMKYGWISGEAATSDNYLQFMVSQVTKWKAVWDAGVWHNCAYEIDFSANTIGFWHSTGSDALTQVVAPVSGSPSSNGADFHVGVLELPRDGYADTTEDYYISGVYIESGSITTSVAGPDGTVSTITTTKGSGTTTTTSAQPGTTLKTSTTSASGSTSTCTSAKYGQCGGIGWTGCTVCASGSTCQANGAYYSQCL